MRVLDKARQLAGAAGTAAAVAAVLGVRVEGRPIKGKDQPARVQVLHLPLFERTESGKQYILWFRIRDVRRD